MSAKYWIYAGILLTVFALGWTTNDWRRDAQENARLKDEKVSLAQQLTDTKTDLNNAIGESNAQLQRVAENNNNEAGLIAASLTEARKVTNDLQKLQVRAAAADAGSCDFTDDADGLRDEAYRRATRAAQRGPASGEADGAHAGSARPGPADAAKRPAGKKTGAGSGR